MRNTKPDYRFNRLDIANREVKEADKVKNAYPAGRGYFRLETAKKVRDEILDSLRIDKVV